MLSDADGNARSTDRFVRQLAAAPPRVRRGLREAARVPPQQPTPPVAPREEVRRGSWDLPGPRESRLALLLSRRGRHVCAALHHPSSEMSTGRQRRTEEDAQRRRSVVDVADDKSRWREIGVAFWNEKHESMSVLLDAVAIGHCHSSGAWPAKPLRAARAARPWHRWGTRPATRPALCSTRSSASTSRPSSPPRSTPIRTASHRFSSKNSAPSSTAASRRLGQGLRAASVTRTSSASISMPTAPGSNARVATSCACRSRKTGSPA